MPQNVTESLKWRCRAAEQGDPTTQYRLGHDYISGKAGFKDPAEGIKWITRAAAQGFAVAQNHLGYSYDTGDLVPQDAVEAYKWYLLAVAQNESRAKVNLAALLPKLNPEQIAEGIRRAAEFKPAIPPRKPSEFQQ